MLQEDNAKAYKIILTLIVFSALITYASVFGWSLYFVTVAQAARLTPTCPSFANYAAAEADVALYPEDLIKLDGDKDGHPCNTLYDKSMKSQFTIVE